MWILPELFQIADKLWDESMNSYNATLLEDFLFYSSPCQDINPVNYHNVCGVVDRIIPSSLVKNIFCSNKTTHCVARGKSLFFLLPTLFSSRIILHPLSG